MARLRLPGKAGVVVKASVPAQASESAYVRPTQADAAMHSSKKRKPEGDATSPSRKMLKPSETSPSKTGKSSPVNAGKLSTPNGMDKGKVTVKARNNNPGIRVQGGRIYDSENGRTCHQCRQKTLEVMALCDSRSAKASPEKKVKTAAKKKVYPCNRYWCPKCLANRYGEMHLDVPKGWSCPVCRGICNCSVCRRKQGEVATGILAHTAKAAGFGSVAALLQKHPDVKPVTNAVVASIIAPSSPAKPPKAAPSRPVNGNPSNSATATPSKPANGMPKKGTPKKGTPVSSKHASPAKTAPTAATSWVCTTVDGSATPSPAPSRRASLPRAASNRSLCSGTPERSRYGKGELVAVDSSESDEHMSCDDGDGAGASGEQEAASLGNGCVEDSLLPAAETPWTPPARPLALPHCCAGLDVGQLLEVTHFLLQFAQPLGLKSFNAEAFLEELAAVPFASGKGSRRGSISLVAHVHAALLQAVRSEMGLRGTVTAASDGSLSWVPLLNWYLGLYMPPEDDETIASAYTAPRWVVTSTVDPSVSSAGVSRPRAMDAEDGRGSSRQEPVVDGSVDSRGPRKASSAGAGQTVFSSPSLGKRGGGRRTPKDADGQSTGVEEGPSQALPKEAAASPGDDRSRFHAVPDSELQAMLAALRGSGQGAKAAMGVGPVTGASKGGYGGLTLPQRLALLKMLCDDVLATGTLRSHIESALERSAEHEKAAKERRAEARRQLRKEAAERRAALIAQLVAGRGELSLEEQRALLEENKVKVAQPRLAALQALDDSINAGRRCVRFAPLGEDRLGRRFWPLGGQAEVPWATPGGLVLMQWLTGDDVKHDLGAGDGSMAGRAKPAKKSKPPQEQWTCLVRDDVEALVNSLDERGIREGMLKQAIQELLAIGKS